MEIAFVVVVLTALVEGLIIARLRAQLERLRLKQQIRCPACRSRCVDLYPEANRVLLVCRSCTRRHRVESDGEPLLRFPNGR